eukprot:204804_1
MWYNIANLDGSATVSAYAVMNWPCAACQPRHNPWPQDLSGLDLLLTIRLIHPNQRRAFLGLKGSPVSAFSSCIIAVVIVEGVFLYHGSGSKMALLFVPSCLSLPRAERVLPQLPSRRPPFHAPSRTNREDRINGSMRKKVALARAWE